ncbi:ap2 domain transcription factor ap2iii-2, partial [Cystoisospora suis]
MINLQQLVRVFSRASSSDSAAHSPASLSSIQQQQQLLASLAAASFPSSFPGLPLDSNQIASMASQARLVNQAGNPFCVLSSPQAPSGPEVGNVAAGFPELLFSSPDFAAAAVACLQKQQVLQNSSSMASTPIRTTKETGEGRDHVMRFEGDGESAAWWANVERDIGDSAMSRSLALSRLGVSCNGTSDEESLNCQHVLSSAEFLGSVGSRVGGSAEGGGVVCGVGDSVTAQSPSNGDTSAPQVCLVSPSLGSGHRHISGTETRDGGANKSKNAGDVCAVGTGQRLASGLCSSREDCAGMTVPSEAPRKTPEIGVTTSRTSSTRACENREPVTSTLSTTPGLETTRTTTTTSSAPSDAVLSGRGASEPEERETVCLSKTDPGRRNDALEGEREEAGTPGSRDQAQEKEGAEQRDGEKTPEQKSSVWTVGENSASTPSSVFTPEGGAMSTQPEEASQVDSGCRFSRSSRGFAPVSDPSSQSDSVEQQQLEGEPPLADTQHVLAKSEKARDLWSSVRGDLTSLGVEHASQLPHGVSHLTTSWNESSQSASTVPTPPRTDAGNARPGPAESDGSSPLFSPFLSSLSVSGHPPPVLQRSKSAESSIDRSSEHRSISPSGVLSNVFRECFSNKQVGGAGVHTSQTTSESERTVLGGNGVHPTGVPPLSSCPSPDVSTPISLSGGAISNLLSSSPQAHNPAELLFLLRSQNPRTAALLAAMQHQQAAAALNRTTRGVGASGFFGKDARAGIGEMATGGDDSEAGVPSSLRHAHQHSVASEQSNKKQSSNKALPVSGSVVHRNTTRAVLDKENGSFGSLASTMHLPSLSPSCSPPSSASTPPGHVGVGGDKFNSNHVQNVGGGGPWGLCASGVGSGRGGGTSPSESADSLLQNSGFLLTTGSGGDSAAPPSNNLLRVASPCPPVVSAASANMASLGALVSSPNHPANSLHQQLLLLSAALGDSSAHQALAAVGGQGLGEQGQVGGEAGESSRVRASTNEEGGAAVGGGVFLSNGALDVHSGQSPKSSGLVSPGANICLNSHPGGSLRDLHMNIAGIDPNATHAQLLALLGENKAVLKNGKRQLEVANATGGGKDCSSAVGLGTRAGAGNNQKGWSGQPNKKLRRTCSSGGSAVPSLEGLAASRSDSEETTLFQQVGSCRESSSIDSTGGGSSVSTNAPPASWSSSVFSEVSTQRADTGGGPRSPSLQTLSEHASGGGGGVSSVLSSIEPTSSCSLETLSGISRLAKLPSAENICPTPRVASATLPTLSPSTGPLLSGVSGNGLPLQGPGGAFSDSNATREAMAAAAVLQLHTLQQLQQIQKQFQQRSELPPTGSGVSASVPGFGGVTTGGGTGGRSTGAGPQTGTGGRRGGGMGLHQQAKHHAAGNAHHHHHPGVCYSPPKDVWRARITVDGRQHEQQFSVKRHGFEEARLLAVQWR